MHDYLCTTFNFSEEGAVKITMKDYINKMLDEVPDNMGGKKATPGGKHLFMVSNKPKLLDEVDANIFHQHTAKLLFLSKRAQPDLHTAVAFLTTQIRLPDEEDYKKFPRCMKYFRGMPGLLLRLEVDKVHVVKWWVDASFATHLDIKSHTKATMSLGKGLAYFKSIRQKLNTENSAEAALVGVERCLKHCCC